MTEKEFEKIKETVVNDDLIKAVASAVMMMCDALSEFIPEVKKAAEKGEMNDLIKQKLIEYVIENG